MARAKKGMKKFHGLFALHFLNLLRTIRKSKHTLALKVQLSDKETGMIYFKKGELVHAECGEILAEDAFIKILEARDGKYSKMEEKAADVISIERDIGTILTDYNKSKSRDKEMPQLTIPGMEEETSEVSEEPEEKEWTPPTPPKHGIQEEAWLKDWSKGVEGFMWASIYKPDGGRVLGIGDEDIDKGELSEILPAAARIFAGQEKDSWKSVYLQTSTNLTALVELLEGYILVVKVSELTQGIDFLKHHLALLVEALDDTLEKA